MIDTKSTPPYLLPFYDPFLSTTPKEKGHFFPNKLGLKNFCTKFHFTEGNSMTIYLKNCNFLLSIYPFSLFAYFPLIVILSLHTSLYSPTRSFSINRGTEESLIRKRQEKVNKKKANLMGKIIIVCWLFLLPLFHPHRKLSLSLSPSLYLTLSLLLPLARNLKHLPQHVLSVYLFMELKRRVLQLKHSIQRRCSTPSTTKRTDGETDRKTDNGSSGSSSGGGGG